MRMAPTRGGAPLFVIPAQAGIQSPGRNRPRSPERHMERQAEKAKTASRLVAVYDAECGWCRRAAARWSALDIDGAVHFIPLQDEAALARLSLSAEEARRAIHAVEFGKTYRGAAAAGRILSRLPRRRWLGQLLQLPVLAPLAEAAYRVIARIRPRKGCC